MLSQQGNGYAEPEVGDGTEDHCAEFAVAPECRAAGEDQHAEREQPIDLGE